MALPPRAFTACPAALFLAAFTSALQAYPQAVQRKSAWLSRDFRSTCPHAEQRWLGYAGGTFSVFTAGAVLMMIRGVAVSAKLAGLFFGFEMLVLIVVSVAALIKNGSIIAGE